MWLDEYLRNHEPNNKTKALEVSFEPNDPNVKNIDDLVKLEQKNNFGCTLL